MGLFKNLDLAVSSTIDWEMTPDYTFGTFESWGGKDRVRSMNERIYYFFIDNYGDSPKLCLMERGIKHARIVAEILAPRELIENCVKKQGKAALFDQSFAIDDALKAWLLTHVVETDDDSMVIPLDREKQEIMLATGLPGKNDPLPALNMVVLPKEKTELSEEDVSGLIRTYNFYDCERNTGGNFNNYLVDNNDNLTVSDRATGLMWQREGFDIMSYRMLCREMELLNRNGFAGFTDWRIPSLAEAMSLMSPAVNMKGQHIHACFSSQQPFIFAHATRNPGGNWFVDYNHGRAFWASGTIPGGFGRLCRSESV
ncbi:MAG: DUF1566 domain-containing protein [Desulfobulbaceae bacterium]|nr:DUF1566 domain-containing protein [Desulfobulbaceae bacterium]